MTNHLHLVVQARRGFDLFVIINDLKTFTAKIILEDIDAESEVRRNWIVEKFKEAALFNHLQVWQTSDHPVRINLEKNSIDEYLQYIHDNPVRNKIVIASQDYLYSSARNHIGIKGLVNIELSDQKNETGFMLHHTPTYKYFPQNIAE
jgi:putative transposase